MMHKLCRGFAGLCTLVFVAHLLMCFATGDLVRLFLPVGLGKSILFMSSYLTSFTSACLCVRVAGIYICTQRVYIRITITHESN
jgi:hypothetical protein